MILPEIIERAALFTAVPEPLYRYRQRGGSIMLGPLTPRKFDRAEVEVVRARYFDRWDMPRLYREAVCDAIKWVFRLRRKLGKGDPEVARRTAELREMILPLAEKIPRKGLPLTDRVLLYTYEHCPRVSEFLWLLARRHKD